MEHPESVSRALAEVIGSRLKAGGITLRSASESTGIPLTTLSRRMGGTSPFSVIELTALAMMLDTTPSDLVSAAEGLDRGAA